MPEMKKIVEALNEDQSKENWGKFCEAIGKSGIKYYIIKFDKAKVNKPEDLRKAYADLYDAKGKFTYKIPVVMNRGKKIRGTTIYLKGLLHLNK